MSFPSKNSKMQLSIDFAKKNLDNLIKSFFQNVQAMLLKIAAALGERKKRKKKI